MSAGSLPSIPHLRLVESGGGRFDSDQSIVEGLLRQERAASEALYVRVERSVTVTLRRVLGSRDPDFEDLVQVTFVRVVESIFQGTYAQRCPLSAWGSVLASRIAVDALRRRRRQRRVFDQGDPGAIVEEAPRHDAPTDEQVQALRQLTRLRAALGRVSADKAQAVVLFDVLGYGLAEVAAMTGVSVAAAQSRVVRGRKELRQLMERNG